MLEATTLAERSNEISRISVMQLLLVTSFPNLEWQSRCIFIFNCQLNANGRGCRRHRWVRRCPETSRRCIPEPGGSRSGFSHAGVRDWLLPAALLPVLYTAVARLVCYNGEVTHMMRCGSPFLPDSIFLVRMSWSGCDLGVKSRQLKK